MSYTYDPTQITARGKDQMRFELGDTAVEDGAETCAMCDEEYAALLADLGTTNKAWLDVKIKIVGAILHKFSFQVDTKVDVLTYDFSSRAEQWQTLLDNLKKEATASSLPIMGSGKKSKPYFYRGMGGNKGGA